MRPTASTEIRSFGVEIKGIDASRALDHTTFKFLFDALNQYSVVYLRNQNLADEQLSAFCKQFGTLKVSNLGRYLVPGMPELNIVSNLKEGDNHVGNPDAGLFWHTDSAYTVRPDMYTFLYAREVPIENGRSLGNTLFANTAAAYDALDDEWKDRVEGLKAVNDLSHQYEKKRSVGFLRRGELTEHQRKVGTSAEHPVVRTHPITGRKALFVSEGHTSHLAGVDQDESRVILDTLNKHITQEQFIYRHEWQVGDLLMWDNSCTLHKAVFDYQLPLRRLMYRATTVGEVPQ